MRDDRSSENQAVPPHRPASRSSRRRGHVARLALGRVGPGLGRAREERSQDRLHPADRLRQRRHGLGAGHRPEVRRQDHPDQGSQLGRRARQARQRRAGHGPRAVGPDLRRAPRHQRPQEGHGHPDEPEPQRPGHHAVQEAGRQGRRRRPLARQADADRQARIHLRADLPDRHPRHVAVLLAGDLRRQPDEGRQGHHRAAAADGGQHARGQHGRLSAWASPGATARSSTASASPA